MTHKIYIIGATDSKNGIGIKGKLPWDIKADMKFFQSQTIKTENANTRNMVIMGRTTWESLPEEHRPLKGRKNVILTRKKDYEATGAETAGSLEEAIKKIDDRIHNIYIIGGAKVYQQIVDKRCVTGIYLTRIQQEFKCDTFFPKIPSNLKPEKIGGGVENGIKFDFILYKRK